VEDSDRAQRKEFLSKNGRATARVFVQQFLETRKKGTAKVETQNYQPGTGPSPEKLKAMDTTWDGKSSATGHRK